MCVSLLFSVFLENVFGLEMRYVDLRTHTMSLLKYVFVTSTELVTHHTSILDITLSDECTQNVTPSRINGGV
jgi:hypothetical protein